MRFLCKEPSTARYIYINPITNKVHLLVPIVGGINIGTDNTCKSAYALKTFFGKNGVSVNDVALHELKRYQAALKIDLILLNDAKAEDIQIKNKKQDRLIQIEQYIRVLEQVIPSAEMAGLSHPLPEYPSPITQLMEAENSNLYGMLLRPSLQDDWLRAKNILFSVNRDHTTQARFYNALQHLNISTIVTSTPRERVIKAVTEKLKGSLLAPLSDELFNSVKQNLREQVSLLFNQNVVLDDIKSDIETVMSLDSESTLDECIEGYLQGLIGKSINVIDSFEQTSPFSDIKGSSPDRVEQISIRTQFFIGLVNIYCEANKLCSSKTNFGRVLDNSSNLSQELVSIVKRALENGDSVEDKLCDFINAHKNEFKLNNPLSPSQIKNIKNNFYSQFNIIKDSPHFDEFIILDPAHNGGFVTHQGSICFDFHKLVRRTYPHLNDQYFNSLDQPQERLSGVINNSNDSVIATFSIDDDAILDYLIQLSKDPTQVSLLAELLLSENEQNKKLFELIPDQLKTTLKLSKNWKQIENTVNSKINTETVRDHFKQVFSEKLYQVALTPMDLRSLYITAIDRNNGPEGIPENYTVLKNVGDLLTKLDIEYDSVIGNEFGGFVVSVTENMKETLKNSIKHGDGKIYMPPAMAANIYKNVGLHYGEQSKPYQDMEVLHNKDWHPKKIKKALELLNVECTNITSAGYSGYIIEANTTNLQLIDNIQQYHTMPQVIHLDVNMVKRLYQEVDKRGLGEQISGLNNQDHPFKIKKTLELLDIPFAGISFASSGYMLDIIPADLFKLRNIISKQIEIENTPAITIEKVAGFRGAPSNSASEVQLNCPQEILTAFINILKDTPILGCTFHNPYTNEMESIPKNSEELTARHLQLLARCERVNTTGVMNTELYQGKLTDNQIAAIRCLVKSTTVAGKVQAHQYGGYKSTKHPINPSENIILVDQSGLQWQGDLRNTGGMFFYPKPTQNLPENYLDWQTEMFVTSYGFPRPHNPSSSILTVKWCDVKGQLDLDLVAKAIGIEFKQALEAVVTQGDLTLAATDKINFKFLKAGMGFFADGLKLLPAQQFQLEHARLRGIQEALESIVLLDEPERQKILGKIKRLELPYSRSTPYQAGHATIDETLKKISQLVEQLGLEWGEASIQDAFFPRPGFVTACNNCGDPHAMIGNEGSYSSVDAMLSMNANVDNLNAGFNKQMQLRVSPSFSKPSSQASFNVGTSSTISSASKSPQKNGNNSNFVYAYNLTSDDENILEQCVQEKVLSSGLAHSQKKIEIENMLNFLNVKFRDVFIRHNTNGMAGIAFDSQEEKDNFKNFIQHHRASPAQQVPISPKPSNTSIYQVPSTSNGLPKQSPSLPPNAVLPPQPISTPPVNTTSSSSRIPTLQTRITTTLPGFSPIAIKLYNKLARYKIARELEGEIRFERLRHFFKGYSGEKKLDAVNTLMTFLTTGQNPDDVITKSLPVLRQGRLGSILRKVAKSEFKEFCNSHSDWNKNNKYGNDTVRALITSIINHQEEFRNNKMNIIGNQHINTSRHKS